MPQSTFPPGRRRLQAIPAISVAGIQPFDEPWVADVNRRRQAGCGDCSPGCASGGGGGYGIPNCPPSGNAVVVYLSNGDGTYQAPILTGVPATGLRSIAVGDFNGDGKVDVAAASDCYCDQGSTGGVIVILLGNGDGTFSVSATLDLQGIVGQASTLAVGDCNHDGKLDLVGRALVTDLTMNGCGAGAASRCSCATATERFPAPASTRRLATARCFPWWATSTAMASWTSSRQTASPT